ncbi:unnamed protein product [Penicillium olsonii]|nr:unnamed protein product [Penicillium olsonii]
MTNAIGHFPMSTITARSNEYHTITCYSETPGQLGSPLRFFVSFLFLFCFFFVSFLFLFCFFFVSFLFLFCFFFVSFLFLFCFFFVSFLFLFCFFLSSLLPFFVLSRFSIIMNGDPVLLKPEGTLRTITFGGSGGIHEDSNHQVLKAPLKHNTQGCNQDVLAYVAGTEEYSEESIAREKLIYQSLPNNDPNILKCLGITEIGIQFPFLQHGDIRTYLKFHSIDAATKDRWIQNAIDAVITIHACGVIHCDISPRNFLVSDDLSIQMCDFAGSQINGLKWLAEEEI